MPITPLEAITYANQNMQVPASKQTDHQNRIEKQNYEALIRATEKELTVDELNASVEDQKIDEEREHQREEAEEKSGEKERELKIDLKKKDKNSSKEDTNNPYHILDIKV